MPEFNKDLSMTNISREDFAASAEKEHQYLIGQKYDTQNGFKADLRYEANGFLCGHVNSAEGFATFHWSHDGFVMGAHQGFDLVARKG